MHTSIKSLILASILLLSAGAALAAEPDTAATLPTPPDAENYPPPSKHDRPDADEEYGYRVAWSPFQLGFLDVYQLFAHEVPIRGLGFGVLSTWNKSVEGVSLAPIYNSADRQRGAALAGICNKAETQEGAVLGGICNLADTQRGFALAGITNSVSNEKAAKSVGIFIAGVVNAHAARSEGAHLALLCNILSNSSGASLAGLWNYQKLGNGLQVAGIYNSARAIDGLRIAGIINDSDADSKDLNRTVEFAGISNLVSGSQSGVLASLLYNSTQESNTGLQLAAFNRAKATRGLQIGLFNDSTELHGVQIGLLNFSGKRMRLPLINVGWRAKAAK